jgi:catechol 2,3-dioxygenase-like lactoylglutathione lyase family enzyme
MIAIRALDHLVLTVASVERTIDFYVRVLGMTPQRFESLGTTRHALAFGRQKFNLHERGNVVDPNVRHATPGSADVCLLTDTPIDDVVRHLARCGVPVILGPSRRTGAVGPLLSVYFYDPDENLVEVANQLTNPPAAQAA